MLYYSYAQASVVTTSAPPPAPVRFELALLPAPFTPPKDVLVKVLEAMVRPPRALKCSVKEELCPNPTHWKTGTVYATINGVRTEMVCDSGSDIFILSEKFVNE